MKPEELDDLLSPLDHPMPRVDVDALIRTARGGRRGTRRAAGIVLAALAAGAGAAFALPGSPVRSWIAQLRGAEGRQIESTEPAGIAVAPGDELVVRFVGAPVGAHVRVSITDGSMVEVRGPAGATRFISEPTRLVVEVATGDTIEVALPRDANLVRLESGDRTLLTETSSTVSTEAPRDVEGRYVLPIGPVGG